jgi:hypothetical protein
LEDIHLSMFQVVQFINEFCKLRSFLPLRNPNRKIDEATKSRLAGLTQRMLSVERNLR